MDEAHPPRRIGRSIGALLAGMFTGIVLSLGTDILFLAIGVFPPWGQSMVGYEKSLLLAIVYRTGEVALPELNHRVLYCVLGYLRDKSEAHGGSFRLLDFYDTNLDASLVWGPLA